MTPTPEKPMEEIRQELHEVTQAVHLLVAHMEETMPEERVKQMTDAVLAEERHSRRRLLATVIVGLLLVLGMAGLAAGTSHNNGQTLDEAKTVADYVRDCLQHPERLTPEQRAERCGSADDNTVQLIRGLLDSINCSLLISPESRTETNTNDCARKAFGG